MGGDRLRALAGLAAAVLVAGCGAAGGAAGRPTPPAAPGSPAPPPPSVALPGTCTVTAADGDAAQDALDGAGPGDTVCVSGGDLGRDLALTSSGTPSEPVVVIADGVTVGALVVEADHVELQGFRVLGGSGLALAGEGLVVRDTVVAATTDDGITCECTDSTVESTTVQGVDGVGIVVEGSRVTVRDNDVSGSIAARSGDADGIRFFGDGHRITGNVVHDISAEGYPEDEEPHTDCFQTFDDDRPPTHDVEVSGNTCRDVDVHCLIATGDERANAGAPDDVASIRFTGNTCDVGGAQAVLLRSFPAVEVTGNAFAGAQYRAVMVTQGSTGTLVADNRFADGLRPFEVDDESRPGSVLRP